jgi:hypothetical protein
MVMKLQRHPAIRAAFLRNQHASVTAEFVG